MEAAGQAADTRTALFRAFAEARNAGDADLMAATALQLPSRQNFGAHPGQVPALVHEAYAAASAPQARCRLAAALAQAWVYGGDAGRAVTFAAEAVELADRLGEPELLAHALDAALLARWGPDDFAERLRLAARLADIAAHLTEPALRLSAHLWRLTTAWECLDVVAVQRQLRALDVLAKESGSVRTAFFAASRRAMHALVADDLGSADRLIARTQELGAQLTDEPDLEAVVHSLAAARARTVGDLDALGREAAAFEQYGASEGVPSVSAEAAVLWLAAGEPGHALDLLHQLAGAGLGAVGRDVDFLLTVSSLTGAAAALHVDDIAAEGAVLLEPYAGRAVLNAGAVTFHGVVDDYLYRAGRGAGHDADRWRHAAASCYRRIGAAWWLRQLGETAPAARSAAAVVHMRQDGAPGWTVGRDGATAALPDRKGLHYLRYLLQRPGIEVSVLELAAAAAGHAGAAVRESGSGEVIDARALASYRQRLRDIDAELADAESWADQARLGKLRLEREALLDEVAAATGLGGRRRRFSSASERARVAVRKAIASALDLIGQHDAALARLLSETVHTGTFCRYDPDPARVVTWLLDPPQGTGEPAAPRRPRIG
jgi:hypothetical protein